MATVGNRPDRTVDVMFHLLILLAGVGAGLLNGIVGSGTLLVFPILLGLGYPPLLANVTTSVGLAPGALSAAWAYRRELTGHACLIRALAALCVVGALGGCLLLLTLPSAAFTEVAPILILVAVALVSLQPLMLHMTLRYRTRHPELSQRLALSSLGLASVYGGYFGAAQGVLYFALAGLLIEDDIQHINALKNMIATCVNGTAAVFFLSTTQIDLPAALLIGIGAATGGQVGVRIARYLPATPFRVIVGIIGIIAATKVLLNV